MLKHGILGLLNYGDKTGYEIMTVFRDSLNHFWTAQTSQIYRELQTMEKRLDQPAARGAGGQAGQERFFHHGGGSGGAARVAPGG